MRTASLKRWQWTHKWTSLVCTIFMLLLSVTGLPLIFHKEIDAALHDSVRPEKSGDAPVANLDRVIAAGLTRYPGEVIQFMVWDDDDPDVVVLSMAQSVEANYQDNRTVRVDARTARVLDAPQMQSRVTSILLKIHSELLIGLPGKLFLGVMGLLFIAAIISGVVLYAPWTRKLEFGAYRRDRATSVRQLDLHNLLGIVTVVWALTVGFTGVLNTWADVVIKIWQYDQLAAMTAAYTSSQVPVRTASVEHVVEVARKAAPDMTPSFISFPGTMLSSKAHFAVFMRGNTPVTSRLLRPALVDASTGQLTDSRALPWYVSTLLLSQPLHFGDYGGMPLKIIWALLDLMLIAILGSGLYLWLFRKQSAAE
jgi:uncharacterized iron-regulated membrane protein